MLRVENALSRLPYSEALDQDIFDFGFSTITKELTQSVGSSTLMMTPIASIRKEQPTTKEIL